MHTAAPYFLEKPIPLAEQRQIAEHAITAAQSFVPRATTGAVPQAQRFVQKLLPQYSLMPPQLLRGIFALSAKTASSHKKTVLHDDVSYSKGASVEYKGAPLVQADLRVLLGLIRQGAGLRFDDAVLTFNAADFLRSIGKQNPCSRAVAALRDSLSSLRSATFVVKDFAGDRGAAFGFVDSVEWSGREVTVNLSARAAWAFESVGKRYVPVEKRCLLTDGVETALADVIVSTSAESYDLVDLAAMWGRADAKELGREVRAALDRLVAVKLIRGWSKTRGRVHVDRS